MPLNDPSLMPTPPAHPSNSNSSDQHLVQRSLQRRVLLSQLPLTISAVLVAIAVLAFKPGVATGSPHFLAGFGGIMLLTVVAGVVPWQRLPLLAYWVIPLLDFVAIAPFWSASRNVLDGMSMLSAFPVLWLAWSGIYPALAVSLGFLGTAAATWWPYLSGATFQGVERFELSLVRPAMVPVLMLGLGLVASVLTRNMKRQSIELQASLDNAAVQNRMLHTVVENAEVGIQVVDRDGNDLLVNQTQRRLHFLGLPPGQREGAERDLLAFGADGTTPLPAEQRPVHRALQGESFHSQLLTLGTDGSQQHLSVSASPMLDEDGEFDGTVVIFENITDLLGAIQAREQFVAEVSHEFRTPLTSIIGYLDLALDEDPDPVLEQYLTTSIRNAERLLVLVTNLLDARASTYTISVQEVDLALLAKYSLESAEVRATQEGVQLVHHLPASLDVVADAVKMGQVVDNLLSNAVKYTPRGGTVTVSLRRVPADLVSDGEFAAGGSVGADGTNGTNGTDGTDPRVSEWAELRVQDTGIGMSEQECGELFANFYRTEHVRKAAIPGTGLGLAISRGFVRAHGGEISVTSQQGVGSTFTVRIPVAGPPSA